MTPPISVSPSSLIITALFQVQHVGRIVIFAIQLFYGVLCGVVLVALG